MTAWAAWAGGTPAPGAYTLGVEEEVMLVRPDDWSLAPVFEDVLPSLSADLAEQTTGETNGAALELRTHVCRTAGQAAGELRALRARLDREMTAMRHAAACCGMHPFAVWQETIVSRSGSSPFWQGRDTGLASTRTSVFQAFPRTGLPRAFDDYTDYVQAVDALIRSQAIPDPTFLWWDARPQPALGTVEIRIMDVPTEVEHTASLVALVHCLMHLEVEQGWSGRPRSWPRTASSPHATACTPS